MSTEKGRAVELYKQALEYAIKLVTMDHPSFHAIAAGRYSELLIADCIEQVYPKWMRDYNASKEGYVDAVNLADAVARIKEQFGIKNETI